ncbi:MAG: GNAT family N-acetyltransferase [Deltaproteobacteria bacterium]|nr:GNAT family N-acetyltransferase [Deltaproteobacteria bacterium]
MKNEESEGPKQKRPAVKIRQMEIDDIAKVFHLGETLFKAGEAPNTYRTWDEYEVIELFYGDVEFCSVAVLKKKIIGFALGSTITKSHSAWKYGHLIWLGVDPAHQQMGVAEKLFKRFKEVMLKENVRMLVVDTEAENIPALKLFRKLGFRNPQQHIYLTMNLESERQLLKKRENGGPAEERNNRNHRHG